MRFYPQSCFFNCYILKQRTSITYQRILRYLQRLVEAKEQLHQLTQVQVLLLISGSMHHSYRLDVGNRQGNTQPLQVAGGTL